MYERFTDRARKVMQLANQEAQRFNHEYVGTEHVLLGLIKEGSGIAASVLKFLDIDLRKVRLEVEKLVQSGPDMIIQGKLPQTPRTKRAIEYAMEEARLLEHNYVGTEHILLGLLRENEGIAAQVLTNLGVTADSIRVECLNLLGHAIEGRENRLFRVKLVSVFGSVVFFVVADSDISALNEVRRGVGKWVDQLGPCLTIEEVSLTKPGILAQLHEPLG